MPNYHYGRTTRHRPDAASALAALKIENQKLAAALKTAHHKIHELQAQQKGN